MKSDYNDHMYKTWPLCLSHTYKHTFSNERFCSKIKTFSGGRTILFSIADLGCVCNEACASWCLYYPVFGKEWRVSYIIQENRSSGECKGCSWCPEPSNGTVLNSGKLFIFREGMASLTAVRGKGLSVQRNRWSPVGLSLVVLLIIFIRFLIIPLPEREVKEIALIRLMGIQGCVEKAIRPVSRSGMEGAVLLFSTMRFLGGIVQWLDLSEAQGCSSSVLLQRYS